jgi:hypothetical protein
VYYSAWWAKHGGGPRPQTERTAGNATPGERHSQRCSEISLDLGRGNVESFSIPIDLGCLANRWIVSESHSGEPPRQRPTPQEYAV